MRSSRLFVSTTAFVRSTSRLFVQAYSSAASYCIDDSCAPAHYHQSSFVYPSIITPQEEEVILQDLQVRMRRRRFEKGHWDAVILQYKEVELIETDGSLSETTLQVLQRVREHLTQMHFASASAAPQWLPSHAIHLKQEGELKAHVDSVRFSGDLVAGLSLGSTSIMRLKPAAPEEIATSNDTDTTGEEEDDDGTAPSSNNDSPPPSSDDDEHHSRSSLSTGHVDLLLEPRSLYAMTGNSRYLFTHELLPDKSVFAPSQTVVERQDRFSIIFRDAKRETVSTTT